MSLDEIIERGWRIHAEAPRELATELETNAQLADDAARAGAFLRLSSHTIGDHLADWPRARELAARVVRALPEAPDLARPLAALAVAQFLSGDWKGALATEARLAGLDPDHALPILIGIDVEVARGLIAAGANDEGAPLYAAALAFARARPDAAGDRVIAIASNNLASELLDRRERTAGESASLRVAAEAAREFWLRCGTWVNEERADYLLALVHNALDEPDKAQECALRALRLIAANGEEKVDEAFLHLALADACRRQGDRPRQQTHLGRADELAAGFGDAGLERWYADERAKVPWA